MRKRIAVFICAISFDNQRRILSGIQACADELDTDVYVFTCHLNYMESEKSKRGAYNIMSLPDIKNFDGVILVKNTIQHTQTADALVERILESGIPAISIDERIEGMPYIGISSYDAQYEVLEHLIEHHGIREINYVTGHISNREGMERYQAYRDILDNKGITYNTDRVFYGNYDMASGRNAVLSFIDGGKRPPRAIVCANDSMAIGVMDQLKAMGYTVPKDVVVTGFDNDELAKLYLPSLTTVERNQEQIGYQAMKLVLTEQKADNCLIPTTLMTGASCGCEQIEYYDLDSIKERYKDKSMIIQQAVDSTKNMVIELSGLECLEDLYDSMKKYIRESDMEGFYLCMCEENKVFREGSLEKNSSIDIKNVNSNYTQTMTIPVAYEKGEFHSYEAFPAGEVLPWQCTDRKHNSFYIVTPIYYQDCCYGYCISVNSEFALRSELSNSWVINIGISLENIRKWRLLSGMVQKLNSLWGIDMLTHLYNRSGFFYFAEKALRTMRERDEEVYIIFMDLDGLKRVNDSLGHEQGDRFICEMADVIRASCLGEELVMRYGGDEYVILGTCICDHTLNNHIDSMKQSMVKINQNSNRPYLLSASIGYSKYRAREIDNLSALIEQADQKMYEEKRLKGNR